ncbi:Oidioi.mRNA.OKI2018_I69.chr2.g7146.t1.cds [Oikopleura dioica]|uniref:Oidioi.mRNA.OKI2018_I69.chr2.g7146.t1.cds n=1 Tax=Oikopleura dioica TaxID=34765 RepID=A0ABN7T7K8_OIKDI|nr:Oidioi.mRNA.OKI2018_I69.chr2.g7146.t1.cds [Oikopleura dioica]
MVNFTSPEPMECNPVDNDRKPKKVNHKIADHQNNYAPAEVKHDTAEFDDEFDDEEFDLIYRRNNNIASQDSTPGSQQSFATGSFSNENFDNLAERNAAEFAAKEKETREKEDKSEKDRRADQKEQTTESERKKHAEVQERTSFIASQQETVIDCTQARQETAETSVLRRVDTQDSTEAEIEERRDPCCLKYERIIIMDENEGPYEGTPPCTFHESYYKRWLNSIKDRRSGGKANREKAVGKAEKKRFAPYWNYDPSKYENKTVELPKTHVTKEYFDEKEM